jgi:hypothetical protein
VGGCLGAKVAGYPSTKGFLAPFVAYIRTCLQSHPRKNSPPWLLLLSGLPINKGIPCSLCCFYKNMSPISTPQELTTMATPLKFVTTDSLFQVLQTLSHHISAVTSIICLLLPFFFAHITTVLGKE